MDVSQIQVAKVRAKRMNECHATQCGYKMKQKKSNKLINGPRAKFAIHHLRLGLKTRTRPTRATIGATDLAETSLQVRRNLFLE